MNTAQKLISFQNFLVVASADGALQGEEKAILMQIGSEMGLTPEDLKPIVNAEKLDIILHEDYEQNVADLGDMLTIAAADQVIFDAEYQVCKNFARKAGINDKEFQELLEVALAQEKENEEEDEAKL